MPNKQEYQTHKVKIQEERSTPEGKLKRRDEYLRNKTTYTNSFLKRRYGISFDDKALMFESQNGKCAICFKTLDLFLAHIDHNHSTGVVRELLCRACNHLIGNCEENEEILSRAIEYLRKHSEGNSDD